MSLKSFSVSCRCTHMQISEESPLADAAASHKVIEQEKMHVCFTRQMHFSQGGGQEGAMESWTEAKLVGRSCSYAGRYCTSAR